MRSRLWVASAYAERRGRHAGGGIQVSAGEATAQPVCSPLARSAIFLVFVVEPGGESSVRALFEGLTGLVRSVGTRSPGAGLTCVVGIGSQAWDRLFAGARPAELHRFAGVVGERHSAVSTPGDVLLHIRAEAMDLCFELAALVTSRLAGAASVVDEVHGFQYFDDRDLLGFVDGTENPSGAAAYAAATVGDEDPTFAGGSYVLVQKYVHDLAAWEALSVEEQERVVGRTKLSNVELGDDVKPSNSHVALNVLEDGDGRQLQILRANMPFGNVGRSEHGTYYIAYSRTPSIVERMLENMFLGDPPGNYDRILDFSTALTGSSYFAPTVQFLDELPPPAAGVVDRVPPGAPA